jgi:hypothetical protein
MHTAAIDPAHDLTGAKTLFPQTVEKSRQLFEGQIFYVDRDVPGNLAITVQYLSILLILKKKPSRLYPKGGSGTRLKMPPGPK